jgi:hypothetical protein
VRACIYERRPLPYTPGPIPLSLSPAILLPRNTSFLLHEKLREKKKHRKRQGERKSSREITTEGFPRWLYLLLLSQLLPKISHSGNVV